MESSTGLIKRWPHIDKMSLNSYWTRWKPSVVGFVSDICVWDSSQILGRDSWSRHPRPLGRNRTIPDTNTDTILIAETITRIFPRNIVVITRFKVSTPNIKLEINYKDFHFPEEIWTCLNEQSGKLLIRSSLPKLAFRILQYYKAFQCFRLPGS